MCSRSGAARIGGVGLQIVRDWVLRFNAEGPGDRGGDSRRGSWQADRDLVPDAMKADSLHYAAVPKRK